MNIQTEAIKHEPGKAGFFKKLQAREFMVFDCNRCALVYHLLLHIFN